MRDFNPDPDSIGRCKWTFVSVVTTGGAVGYDSTLLSKKLKDADSGNPNIYNSIEDLKADNKNNMEHVYDEIKGIKVLKEEGECRLKSDFSRCMHCS